MTRVVLTKADNEFCEALKETVDTFVREHPGYDVARAIGMVFGNAIGWMTDAGLSGNVILSMCQQCIERKTERKNLS